MKYDEIIINEDIQFRRYTIRVKNKIYYGVNILCFGGLDAHTIMCDNIKDWCLLTLGAESATWKEQGRYYVIHRNRFLFRDEPDITMFLLRWI